MQHASAKTRTIGAGAIPLGEAAAGRGAKDFNAHRQTHAGVENPAEKEWEKPALFGGGYVCRTARLEFGVGVRTDLAVEVDLFVLRGNPFHERRSLRGINDNDKREHSTSAKIEEEGKNP
jgi:hypothetical protein